MRFNRRGVVGAIAACLLLVISGCGDSGDDAETTGSTVAADRGTCAEVSGSSALTVGSTNFAEQEIVAELYAQCLDAAGFDVTKKLKIGARDIAVPALQSGDIDLYPEYVGSLLTFLGGTPTPDLQVTLTDLQTRFGALGVTILEPAPAEDKNGFAVTRATADR